jgi:hypothetical protein
MTATGGAASGNTAQNIVVNSAGNASAFHPILFTPASLSAGSAVSSDGTISFNPSTDILSVSGLAVTATTASTSPTTGALVVTGGVGIGQSLNVGGRVGIGTDLLTGQINIKTSLAATPGLVVQGAASQTADYAQFFTSTGATSLSIDKDGKITFPSQSSIQLFAETYSSSGRIRTSGPMIVYGSISSFSDGVNESYLNSSTLYIGGLTWTIFGGNRWSTNSPVRIQPTSTSVVPLVVQLQNASWTSGNAFEIQNNSVLKFNVDYAGSTTILSTVGSGSTTTGALVVSGGVGIGGSIFGGSTISAADNIEIKSGKELRLNNSGNTFYTGIKAGANTSNTTYTFPVAFPGTGTSVLQSDTSGTLSWTGIVGNATTATNINVVSATTSASHRVLFTPATGTASGAAVSSESTFVYNPSTEILNVSGLAVTAGTASTSSSTGSLIVSGGAGIAGAVFIGENLNIGADLNISGLTTLTYTSEKLTTKTSAGSASTVTHDLSTGSIFYHSSISNNFTANFTNVPTTNDRAIGVTLVLAQGGTGYIVNVLQIDGSTQTIKWVNNTTPTGTANKVDIVGFSLIRTGSAWTVLGQYSTYG